MGKEGCVQLQALFCAQLSNQLHVADKDFTFLREIRDVITQRMLFGGFQVPQEQNSVLGHPVMGQQDGSRYLCPAAPYSLHLVSSCGCQSWRDGCDLPAPLWP